MEPADQSHPPQPRVIISGRGESSEIALRVALTRRGIDVLPPAIGELVQALIEETPDLLLLIGDDAEDGGARVLRSLAKGGMSALAPIAILLDELSADVDYSAFLAGMVGEVARGEDVEEVAREIALIVNSMSDRPGLVEVEVGAGEGASSALVQMLRGRAGVLQRRSGNEGPAWLAIGAEEDMDSAAKRVDAFVSETDGEAEISYAFREWTGGRLRKCVMSAEPEAWEEQALRGLRVLVLDSDSDRAGAIAAEMKKHYALVAVRPPQAGLGMDPDLDPEVVILDGAALGLGGLDTLNALHADPRLRWVNVVIAEWDEGQQVDEMSFGNLAHAIVEGTLPAQELARLTQGEEDFGFPVRALGPRRAIRVLSNAEGVWSLFFDTGAGRVEVDITEGLIVGARGGEGGDGESRAQGIAALRGAIDTRRGRLRARPITEAHIANLMSPIDEAFDEASSSAPRASVGGLPVDPPPLSKAEGTINPKATLLGVAPPASVEVPGLDEPFSGPTSVIPPPASDVPPSPPAADPSPGDPFEGAGETSGEEGSSIALESAPPGIELISEPPSGFPPAPPKPSMAGGGDTVKTTALSLEDDEEPDLENMPTQAIPQLSVEEFEGAMADGDVGAGEGSADTGDGMEKLAATARAEAGGEVQDDGLERYSAYPTIRAPSLADLGEGDQEVDLDDDHPTQAIPQTPGPDGAEDADGVFATVRLSELELDGASSSLPSMGPLDKPVMDDEGAGPEEPDDGSLKVPSFVVESSSESGGRILGIWAFLFICIAVVIGIIVMEHEIEDPTLGSESPSPTAEPSIDPPTPAVAVAPDADPQPAIAEAVAPTEPDAAAEPSTEPDAEVVAQAEPDAEVVAQAEPDAEVAAPAVPDAEVVAEAPAPSPAETGPPASASASSVPSPDALPPCPGGIRRTSRWSRTLSNRGLAATTGGDLGAAATAFAESICADQRNPHAAIGYARLALAQGQAQVAVAWADRACQMRRRRAEYQVVRGDALLSAGQHVEAMNAWREALRIEPRNRDARERLDANQ